LREDLRKLSFGTAIFITSLDLTAISTDPTIKRIMKMGNKKVERIKLLRFTLDRYSLLMIMNILFMLDLFR
jgi:hypothetical protein